MDSKTASAAGRLFQRADRALSHALNCTVARERGRAAAANRARYAAIGCASGAGLTERYAATSSASFVLAALRWRSLT
jgi:hypothetical protein